MMFLKSVGVIVGALIIVGLLILTILITKPETSPDTKPDEEPLVLRELDWWENAVIYQIYPQSFKDSDGDGVGDLQGVISELEHFVDAGVGVIYMTPIFTSPMVDLGYDVSDFYSIHNEYGTLNDFVELVEKAHDVGIRVLVNYVPNHASNLSVYFLNSIYQIDDFDDYFVWANPLYDENYVRMPPSNWVSQYSGSAWTWNGRRQQYYLHQFGESEPDFNFREPAVKEEMLKIMRFWLERGVDGFKFDSMPHLYEIDGNQFGGSYPDEPLTGLANPNLPGYTTQEFTRDQNELYDIVYEWREFLDGVKEEFGNSTKLLIMEAYANVTGTMAYYGDAHGRRGAHFPVNLDIVNNLYILDSARDFVYIIQKWLTYMPNGYTANWMLSNHNYARTASNFGDNHVDGLNALIMMLPGVAMTYQGEEIGMRNSFVTWEDSRDTIVCKYANSSTFSLYTRDPARTPYHWNNSTNAGFSNSTTTWLPVADDYMEINLEAQMKAERSHYKVYKSLTTLRKQKTLSHGDHHIQVLSDRTFILVRHLKICKTYTLIFNVNVDHNDTIDLTEIVFLKEPLTVYVSSVDSNRIAGDKIPLGELTLKPGEALVLQSP